MRRFLKSEHTRQSMLDLLNERGEMTVPELSSALGITRGIIRNTATSMSELGELARNGSNLSVRYRALKKTTVSAAEMYTRARTRKEAETETKPSIPGRYINDPTKHNPPRNQGGQGSAGRSSIGSGMYGACW